MTILLLRGAGLRARKFLAKLLDGRARRLELRGGVVSTPRLLEKFGLRLFRPRLGIRELAHVRVQLRVLLGDFRVDVRARLGDGGVRRREIRLVLCARRVAFGVERVDSLVKRRRRRVLLGERGEVRGGGVCLSASAVASAASSDAVSVAAPDLRPSDSAASRRTSSSEDVSIFSRSARAVSAASRASDASASRSRSSARSAAASSVSAAAAAARSSATVLNAARSRFAASALAFALAIASSHAALRLRDGALGGLLLPLESGGEIRRGCDGVVETRDFHFERRASRLRSPRVPSPSTPRPRRLASPSISTPRAPRRAPPRAPSLPARRRRNARTPLHPSSLAPSRASPRRRPSSPRRLPSSPRRRPSSLPRFPSSPRRRPSSPHQPPSSPRQLPSSPHQPPSSPRRLPSSPRQLPSSPHQRPSSPHQPPSSPHQPPRRCASDSPRRRLGETLPARRAPPSPPRARRSFSSSRAVASTRVAASSPRSRASSACSRRSRSRPPSARSRPSAAEAGAAGAWGVVGDASTSADDGFCRSRGRRMRCARMGTGTEGRRRRGRARRRCPLARLRSSSESFCPASNAFSAALVESRGVDVRIVIARAAVGRVPENGGEARLETFLVLASGRVGRVGAPGGGRRGVRPGGQLLSQRRALGLLLALVLFQAFLAALEVPRLAVHGDGTDGGTVGARAVGVARGFDRRTLGSVGGSASLSEVTRDRRVLARALADDGAFASV